MSRPPLEHERVRLQLAEVHRDRLGRFSRLDFLRTCDPLAGCGVDADLEAAVAGMDAFLETLEYMAGATDPDEARELAGLVREYRRTLRADLEALEQLESTDGDPAVLRRAPPKPAPLWVSGLGVGEHMDVTGLSGKDAATLALVLNKWTNGGRKKRAPTYRWRNGKRYMAGPSRHTVDVNHPIMAPFRDDLLAAMRDPDSAREFEVDEASMIAADVGAEMEAGYQERGEAEALERKASRPASAMRGNGGPWTSPEAGELLELYLDTLDTDAKRDAAYKALHNEHITSFGRSRRRYEAIRDLLVLRGGSIERHAVTRAPLALKHPHPQTGGKPVKLTGRDLGAVGLRFADWTYSELGRRLREGPRAAA